MFRSIPHLDVRGPAVAALTGIVSIAEGNGPDRAVIGPTPEPDGSLVAIIRWTGPIGFSDASAWIDSAGGTFASVGDGPVNGMLRCIRAEPWLELGACDGPWVGLTRFAATTPGTEPWRWSDSSPLGFLAWSEGRPSGSHRLPGFVAMDDAGTWIDVLSGPDAGVTVRSAAVRWRENADADGNGVPDPIDRDGIDWVRAGPECGRNPADLDGNGRVDALDLAIVLGAWGGSGTGDIDGNGVVDAVDLAEVLGRWT